jgi:L-threonylcarbamoyladenylate synthase
MTPTPVRRLPPLAESRLIIEEAAAVLRRGGLVVFPTETVYGLGADAENPAAVRRVYAAKGRPADHPVILHVAEPRWMQRLAAELPDAAWILADAFWPGPMTLVVHRSAQVDGLVTGGLPTVGLRVPAHPVARALLHEFGRPVAAPSANRFGRVSPTCVQHVLEELDGCVDLILDGGPCAVGLESTIVDVSSGPPVVLRPGAVTVEQIEAVLQLSLAPPTPSAPRVSGCLPSHYAPRARVEIVRKGDLAERSAQLAGAGSKVAVLAQGEPGVMDPRVVLIEMPRGVDELAQSLYAALRRVDDLGCDVALTSLPPEAGLGAAIADRLRRAAGPRDADA